VRQAEITALFILDDTNLSERMVRPSVIGVAPRMAHSD